MGTAAALKSPCQSQLYISGWGARQTWRSAAVTLNNIRFADGQNGGTDFRLWAGEGQDLIARRVTVTRIN